MGLGGTVGYVLERFLFLFGYQAYQYMQSLRGRLSRPLTCASVSPLPERTCAGMRRGPCTYIPTGRTMVS